jgi:alpha-L-fucosidase
MLWFDNGVDMRFLDPLKLWIAAYYYNRAAEWGKEVSLSTKKAAYAPEGNNLQTIGSIIDFEKIGSRSPSGIRTGAWQVDDPIGSTWGYTSDMRVANAGSIIAKLADTVSKNGNLLLNLSPKSDGTFPQEQQDTLRAIGAWLKINGEAIYGTHNWIKFAEGNRLRFTINDDFLYAIITGNWPGDSVTIKSLATGAGIKGTITAVTMLGSDGPLKFTQNDQGLTITLPAAPPCKYAYVLRIAGLKMNAPADTESGNPE